MTLTYIKFPTAYTQSCTCCGTHLDHTNVVVIGLDKRALWFNCLKCDSTMVILKKELKDIAPELYEICLLGVTIKE